MRVYEKLKVTFKNMYVTYITYKNFINDTHAHTRGNRFPPGCFSPIFYIVESTSLNVLSLLIVSFEHLYL